VKCLECEYEFHGNLAEYKFCPACGKPLPDFSDLSPRAKYMTRHTECMSLGVFLLAAVMFSIGAVLWFIAPSWFDFTESRTMRVISIALMITGPVILILSFVIIVKFEDSAIREAQMKKPEE
jgi:hypothetical protein